MLFLWFRVIYVLTKTERGATMQDKTMQKAMDEFILQRINSCGSHETDALQDAYAEFKCCVEKLKGSLSTEQKTLLTKCDDAYRLVDGETQQCYYRAGFSDAVIFLLGWRDGTWK